MKDISREEMIAVLNAEPDGVLSISDGETPYGLPFGHVYVNDMVYLSMFPKGRKWEYLNKNSKVCFSVYRWNEDHTEWVSVVVDGDLEPVTDMDEIQQVVKALIVKMNLDPDSYVEKRMEYYRKNQDNPNSLKVFKIRETAMGGRTMHTMMGS